MLPKFLDLVKQHQHSIFLVVMVILISIISFNLGRISSSGQSEIKIEDRRADIFNAAINNESNQPSLNTINQKPNPAPAAPTDTRVVVSKNSDKYHFTWCPGAKQIKEGNQIWFDSAQEAERAGYILAGNCK